MKGPRQRIRRAVHSTSLRPQWRLYLQCGHKVYRRRKTRTPPGSILPEEEPAPGWVYCELCPKTNLPRKSLPPKRCRHTKKIGVQLSGIPPAVVAFWCPTCGSYQAYGEKWQQPEWHQK